MRWRVLFLILNRKHIIILSFVQKIQKGSVQILISYLTRLIHWPVVAVQSEWRNQFRVETWISKNKSKKCIHMTKKLVFFKNNLGWFLNRYTKVIVNLETYIIYDILETYIGNIYWKHILETYIGNIYQKHILTWKHHSDRNLKTWRFFKILYVSRLILMFSS